MNTIEAIRFINDHIRRAYYMGVPERMKADDINRLLRQGEKYKKMWQEFKFKRGDTYAILEQPDKGTIRDDMDEFEKKYFPKKR